MPGKEKQNGELFLQRKREEEKRRKSFFSSFASGKKIENKKIKNKK